MRNRNSRYFLSTVLVLFALGTTAQVPNGYYSNAEGKTGDALKTALHNIIKNNVVFGYNQCNNELKYTDEDPNNKNNVLLLYSGWSYPKSANGGGATQWNKEHTWAKSQGNFGTSRGPGTDIHHLRPTDCTVNSARGNLMFDEGGSAYTDKSRRGGGDGATGCKKTSNTWEPADRVKGDVARMLFYMATRYESEDKVDLELAENSHSSGNHGRLSTLLKWHKQDPVSEWEIRRNNRIFERQKNRNPFIDHPEYVAKIWGDDTTPAGGDSGSGGGTNTGSSVLNLTFDTNLQGAISISVSGTVQWTFKSFKDKGYAYINTHNKGANESWLVTPTVNMNDVKNAKFAFDVTSYNADKSIADCGTEQFEVYYANNPNTDNINSNEWTRLTEVDNVMLGAKWDFVTVTIDAKAIKGDNVRFAFRHRSNDTNGTTWEVDNVKVSGKSNTGVDNTTMNNIKLFPNPGHNYVVFSQAVNNVKLFNLEGKSIIEIDRLEKGSQLDISQLEAGIYVVKTQKNLFKLIKK